MEGTALLKKNNGIITKVLRRKSQDYVYGIWQYKVLSKIVIAEQNHLRGNLAKVVNAQKHE